jgi:sugar (pentulose or hexulose) kinase
MLNVKSSGTRPGATASPRRNTTPSSHVTCAFFAGLDFGTSGARITVIDDTLNIVSDSKLAYPDIASSSWPIIWENTLSSLLLSIPPEIRMQTQAIAFDGTSATSLLVESSSGRMLAAPKLYNEAQSPAVVEVVKALAPPSHTTTASTSTLCKLITWTQESKWQGERQPILLHQADWLASLLHGDVEESGGVSDWNNALKVGFDPMSESYPAWLMAHECSALLPKKILPPGTVVGRVRHASTSAPPGSFPSPVSQALPTSCLVVSGTTDSIAAFIAAKVDRKGQAVTSLGSTLAIKMISETRVDDAEYGVYSHRLGNGSWLVGGASNTGGALLKSLFTDHQLRDLTALIKARGFDAKTGLTYYPLLKPGERFPINDPQMQPVLSPRPEDDSLFLQGIFEALARIEGEAYRLLEKLGATPVQEVLTAGGGSVNEVWTKMREREIGVPVRRAEQGEASYGSALLAREGFIKHTLTK